jgi:hypothetical protein
MEGLFVLIGSFGSIVLFALLATGFGVDSRDQIGDDHARSAGF